MARPIWNGSISFGLVNVPVKLYSAVQSQAQVSFHQLHGKDNSRIKQKRVSVNTDEEVPYDEIVKGYELAPGQYVIIDPEELESLDPKASRTIDIEDFVDLTEIDPVYYDRPYYLGPSDKASAKAYRLLLEAMKETNKVAIARFVMRGKQYLAAIRPRDGVLVLSTMNYADEIASPDVVAVPDDEDVEVKDREITMAKQLIESLSDDFDPTKYEDEYRNRVMEMIKAKAEGQEIVIQPTAEEPARVVDLMAALEESLEAAKAKRQAS